MVKASELIAWCRKHLGDGYVYGAVGQTITVSLLQSLEKMWGPNGTYPAVKAGYYHKDGNYSAGRCARWIGKWGADCSGLIKKGRAELSGEWADVSAQGTYDQCSVRGQYTAGMNLTPGMLIFMWSSTKNRMGHVGIYVGNGKVIEARGVDYGIVETALSARAWGYYGAADWMELDLPKEGITPSRGGTVEADDGDASNTKPGDLIMRKGDRGDFVKQIQSDLIVLGYDLGKWGSDGVFGAQTESAVKTFQGDVGLIVTGIADIPTQDALASCASLWEKKIKSVQDSNDKLLQEYKAKVTASDARYNALASEKDVLTNKIAAALSALK